MTQLTEVNSVEWVICVICFYHFQFAKRVDALEPPRIRIGVYSVRIRGEDSFIFCIAAAK